MHSDAYCFLGYTYKHQRIQPKVHQIEELFQYDFQNLMTLNERLTQFVESVAFTQVSWEDRDLLIDSLSSREHVVEKLLYSPVIDFDICQIDPLLLRRRDLVS